MNNISKQEFLNEMINFGQKLLEEEDQNIKDQLQNIWMLSRNLVNAAAKLENKLIDLSDCRVEKLSKITNSIIKIQELIIPLAENESIDLG